VCLPHEDESAVKFPTHAAEFLIVVIPPTMDIAIALSILRRGVKGLIPADTRNRNYTSADMQCQRIRLSQLALKIMSPIGNCIAKQSKQDNDEMRRGLQEGIQAPYFYRIHKEELQRQTTWSRPRSMWSLSFITNSPNGGLNRLGRHYSVLSVLDVARLVSCMPHSLDFFLS